MAETLKCSNCGKVSDYDFGDCDMFESSINNVYCKFCGKVLNKWKDVLKNVPFTEEIVTNKSGGKQSKIVTAFSLIPHKALLEVGKVMAEGAKRYEKDNWRKLSPDEIYDHMMEHFVNWHINGDMEELAHGVTRAMMLFEVVKDKANKETIL